MARKPDFITFTGFDDWTPIDGMRELASRYPIEWGVLFSPKRQGVDPRYPGGEAQSRIAWSGLRIAAHLCGGWSDAIMAGESIAGAIPVDLGVFSRIQINHAAPDPVRIAFFRRGWGPRCIAQSRGDAFPKNPTLDWLHDCSGGRGVEAKVWPPYPHRLPGNPSRLVGYAGGIGPDSVLSAIEAIDASGPYWIDMESKVRTGERFDLDLCRQVCEAVYGPTTEAAP